MLGRRKWLGCSLVLLAITGLFLVSPVAGQPRGTGVMAEDVYTPIAKGYDLLRDGKYDAAKYDFEQALKADRYNPFALNNLAVLTEREGKLREALAYLKDASTHAADYKDKVEQTCFVGGGCTAVKPVRVAGPNSTIGPIIQENTKRLEEEIAKQKTPPSPGSPPPMK